MTIISDWYFNSVLDEVNQIEGDAIFIVFHDDSHFNGLAENQMY